MPRKKKEPKDMTSEELAKKVFPPKVLKELRKIAHKGENAQELESEKHE